MSNEEYVTYEQAKVLKAAGFDYECDYHFSKEDAPGGLVWGIKSFCTCKSQCEWLSVYTNFGTSGKVVAREKELAHLY